MKSSNEAQKSPSNRMAFRTKTVKKIKDGITLL
jgi:hypothetical protein